MVFSQGHDLRNVLFGALRNCTGKRQQWYPLGCKRGGGVMEARTRVMAEETEKWMEDISVVTSGALGKGLMWG